MNRLLIVSNRIPYNIEKKDGEIEITTREGAKSTGLENFYKENKSFWLGSAGLPHEDFTEEEIEEVNNKLSDYNCKALFLSAEEIHQHGEGFCNSTLWPLFHYFADKTSYNHAHWLAYQNVNEKFANFILENIKDEDKVWIHDFHMMLLPKMIRDKIPNISIGYFLHIPFPSYEIFRLLPWRAEILEGLLGSDLIGFHTYDYERHFMSCVRRLLGLDTFFNQVKLDEGGRERVVKVDAYPLGIDYDKYQQAAIDEKRKSIKDRSKIQREIERYFLTESDRKLILSIDRLDYHKGIPDRLETFEYFLELYPQFHEKVSLILLTYPYRERNNQSLELKREVDELVGRINGKFASIDWTPVWYFFRLLPFETLIELYSSCDIALITPNRDGMNLIAKQYIASRPDDKGVLILSEMAGAAKEMSEAIIVNPNNRDEVAEAIKDAINLSEDVQISRNKLLKKRLKRYNQEKWATDFINSLEGVKKLQATKLTKKLNKKIIDKILTDYKKSDKHIFFLDYDGTLAGFNKDPQKVGPDGELEDILKGLTAPDNNEVVIISGRDKETLGKWFDKSWDITFVAEHGVWIRYPGKDWEMIQPIDAEWKEIIHPVLEYYVDRTPRTFIEEKNYSLAWHYRDADPDLGTMRAWELKDELRQMVSNLNLEILDGDKVIELKTAGINKGRGASERMGNNSYDFVFAIGDDWTDEYTFDAMPDKAYTIKVGIKSTQAKYYIEDVPSVRKLLSKFNE